jgi:hypothetical protein
VLIGKEDHSEADAYHNGGFDATVARGLNRITTELDSSLCFCVSVVNFHHRHRGTEKT